MTHPPATHENDFSNPSSSAPSVADAVMAGLATSAEPFKPNEASTVDQSGRPLGPRALRTRIRIREATVSLLNEKSLRELRVIDIARRIGSSPATFYQYFKDVRDVVLELATDVSASIPDLVEIIDGDWTGAEGLERGRLLANTVIDYWEQYAAILRVRNNAADEGDAEFAAIRMKAMLPMVTAFADIIGASQAVAENKAVDNSDDNTATSDECVGGRLYPISVAMIFVSGLEAMAVHRRRFEKRFAPMGEARDQIVETMATTMQLVITSGR